MRIRDLYLDTSAATIALIGRPEVAARWIEPSVLPELTVGGIAGHLARSTLQVDEFLDAPPFAGPDITAVRYYADLVGVQDPTSALNVGVRARSEATASLGHPALVEQLQAVHARLVGRLGDAPADRRVDAFGRNLLLDQYLHTRMIEMTVHHDDLVLSLHLDPTEAPALPPDAYADATQTLVAVAVRRHGALTVLRALTRRERDPDEALRVL